MKWEPVIGLEVHVQLSTRSKIFSGASTAFGAEPNTQACIIDLGMPGVLPVLNKEAVRCAVKFGLSINAEISKHSVFARKNYFYPDLPKGYQISQYEHPIVLGGFLDIENDGTQRRIGITRAHLEEDAGKSLHEDMSGFSAIDLNRAGTPLLEIVSEPELYSAKEAIAYLKTLHTLVRYLEISDGNMQEGSFRCDVNLSLRPKGTRQLGTRAEIKNLNSFRFIERAIANEIARQSEILDQGGSIKQETRLYDPDLDVTRSMRSKEEAHDYRYFPDPDLLPTELDDAFIENIKVNLPELPWDKLQRFQTEFGLNAYDAKLLSQDRSTGQYFEEVLSLTQSSPKLVANWINGDLAAALNKANLTIEKSPIKPKQLSELLDRISDQTISGSMAKTIFESLWQGEGSSANEIIEKRGLKQISDTGMLEKIIDEVIANHPEQALQYRSGKDKLMAFFVGQTMKSTQGKADPQQVNVLLKKKLG